MFLEVAIQEGWCRVERDDVPEDHFQALLVDIPKVFINRAREMRRPLYGKKFPWMLCFFFPRFYNVND